MFDSLRLLTNSRLFRKRRCINRLQRLLKFLSLSLFLSVFLHMCAWACRPAAVMFVSASAAPYTADCTAGDGPQLWTVGRRRRHPDSPLVFGGRATAAGTAGGFIALLVCFLLIYLWHTHPITPLTLAHTPSRRFARFPAKGSDIFPLSSSAFWSVQRERSWWKKEDFMISCPGLFVAVSDCEGRAFHTCP